jgi:hypothetical protein
MANKKTIGISLILMAVVAGTIFAANFGGRPGYYRTTDNKGPANYVLVLIHNSGASWTIQYLDNSGNNRGSFSGTESGFTINFTANGRPCHISTNGSGIVESLENRFYSYYKGL